MFISIYDFNHAFCWNLITLGTFLNFNPLFDPCFKALMCMINFSLPSILQASFSTFSNFLLSGKMVALYEISINFLDTLYMLQENILHHFFHHNFLWTLHWNLIYNHYTTQNHLQVTLFASKYVRYDDSIFHHNSACIYYLLQHIYVLIDTFLL